MLEFLGRDNELANLEKIHSWGGFQSIKIHGRRQIGKTSLLRKFTSNKNAIFFTASDGGIISNYERLRDVVEVFSNTHDIGDSLNLKLQNTLNFHELLERIFEISLKYHIVFVIDEYNYLVESGDFDQQYFKSIIDKYKMEAKMTLILCGSNIGFFQSMDAYSSPLCGRILYDMSINPINIKDSLSWLSSYHTASDIIQTLMLCSGYPTLLNNAKQYKTFSEFATELIFGFKLFLPNFCKNIVLADHMDTAISSRLMYAIESGKKSLNDLQMEFSDEWSSVEPILNILTEINLVGEKSPLFSKYLHDVKQYEVIPNIFKLWCLCDKIRFSLSPEEFINSPLLSNLFGHLFESFCREFVAKGYFRYRPDYIGYWEDKETQDSSSPRHELDIVGKSEYHQVLIACECNYKSSKSKYTIKDLDLLRYRISLIGTKYKSCLAAVFSKTPFTDEVIQYASKNNINLFTLEQMLNILKPDLNILETEQTNLLNS